MQIIVPMSGFGERFRNAGYKIPKPLITVDGKPIIEHVIDLFPGETNFTFVCNQEHLDNSDFRMQEIIENHCPGGKVIGIKPHKLGPVFAISEIIEHIDLEMPTVVNYCDFSCYWDWKHFRKFVEKTQCMGAIPAYRGFHPHSLGKTNYAYLQQVDGWVKDIQEKRPFTSNKMNEFASSGTYYFKSGSLMINSFKKIIDKNLTVNGEFYVSMAFKPLLEGNEKVAIYPLQHFMQWGTPEDLAVYQEWSNYFRQIVSSKQEVDCNPKGSIIVPMAGLGARFKDEGYDTIKPLIEVSGKPMVKHVVEQMPIAEKCMFVTRLEESRFEKLEKELTFDGIETFFKNISSVSKGQACSAAVGLESFDEGKDNGIEPITFTVCDSAAIFNISKFKSLLESSEIDVIVWGFRGHSTAARHPDMFGWINHNQNGLIESISVKKALDNPSCDPIIIGNFTFKKKNHFTKAFEKMLARNGTVNGEYYMDELINDSINLGHKCKLFEVDNFVSWGTPNDLKTFKYWQSCFHKWPGHSYDLRKDNQIENNALNDLEARALEFDWNFDDIINA